jgi:hypothetical protein
MRGSANEASKPAHEDGGGLQDKPWLVAPMRRVPFAAKPSFATIAADSVAYYREAVPESQ